MRQGAGNTVRGGRIKSVKLINNTIYFFKFQDTVLMVQSVLLLNW